MQIVIKDDCKGENCPKTGKYRISRDTKISQRSYRNGTFYGVWGVRCGVWDAGVSIIFTTRFKVESNPESYTNEAESEEAIATESDYIIQIGFREPSGKQFKVEAIYQDAVVTEEFVL